MREETADWQGFAVVCDAPPEGVASKLEMSEMANGWSFPLSGKHAIGGEELADLLFAAAKARDAIMLRQGDPVVGPFRALVLEHGVMTGALLLGPAPLDISRAWLMARLGTDLNAEERFKVLDGRPGGAMTPRGPTVCICCLVGRNTITEAIADGCGDVASIAAATRAGTNCGNCRPDIQAIIAEVTAAPAAR